ncbi:FAD-binding oxidoreductase [Candidatus Puniceispirillum sp.]|nr:FAD-binding oxidoreductase [Candidatus Puniceispirillum sp.]
MDDRKPNIIDDLIAMLGEKAVLRKADDTKSYLSDWHNRFHGAAHAVVLPVSTAQVSEIMAYAKKHNIVVVPQGGNTGFMGGATPDKSGNTILLSLRRMNKVRDCDAKNMSMTVEAGCILQNLQDVAENEGLYFPLNLAAKGSCTIGGNLGTNAGGLNVVRYGTARALTLGLEVVLMGGEILDMLSGLRKDNTGYDLKDLFIGSEGTLGIITAATMRLFPIPVSVSTAFAEVRDVDAAVELLQKVQAASGGMVEAFELIPADIMHVLFESFPDIQLPLAKIGDMNVLMEIGSTNPADNEPDGNGSAPIQNIMESVLANAFEEGLVIDATIANSDAQRDALWEVRESAPESHKRAGKVVRSDVALTQSALAPFYADMVAGIKAIDSNIRICGYGHIGDGNLHFNLVQAAGGDPEFDAKTPKLLELIYSKVTKYGGSISAEHGIGQAKRDQLVEVKSPAIINTMKAIKAALDPKNLMNPGKVI